MSLPREPDPRPKAPSLPRAKRANPGRVFVFRQALIIIFSEKLTGTQIFTLDTGMYISIKRYKRWNTAIKGLGRRMFLLRQEDGGGGLFRGNVK